MQNQKEELVFVAAKRTPFGAFGGSLKKHSANDLAVESSKAALKQSGLAATDIDAVVFGNVIQTSADAIYLARHVGLKTGMPIDRPALNVNRLCGSGFEAAIQAAYYIRQEGMNAVLIGGSESMTQAPYVVRSARFGQKMGNTPFEDMLSAGLTDSYVNMPMAITAENLAVKYNISRTEVDTFALQSQQRAKDAWEKGVYAEEVEAGSLPLAKDEHFRADASLEGLAKLKPVFKADGVVTAGNASGICDGSASLILCSKSFAQKKGAKILGTLKSWGFVGCDPAIMGIGPVAATHKAIKHYEKEHGKTVSVQDFRLVEVNEAFASQFLAVEKELKLNREKTNIHGGAIALGHPLAASGARITAHLLYALKAAGGGLGLGSACIGGGQGISVIVEV